jgi:hypothetical protein
LTWFAPRGVRTTRPESGSFDGLWESEHGKVKTHEIYTGHSHKSEHLVGGTETRNIPTGIRYHPVNHAAVILKLRFAKRHLRRWSLLPLFAAFLAWEELKPSSCTIE